MSSPTTLPSRWRTRADQQHNLDVEAQAHTLKARDHTGYREADRSKPVGDGHDDERLLRAEEVGEILRVPVKSVYDLPIKRVRIGQRRLRWRPVDVREFVNRRVENPA